MPNLKNDPLNFHTHQIILQTSLIQTSLGPMIGVADKYSLYFLGFEDTKNTARDIERLRKRLKAIVEPLLYLLKKKSNLTLRENCVISRPLVCSGDILSKNGVGGFTGHPLWGNQKLCRPSNGLSGCGKRQRG